MLLSCALSASLATAAPQTRAPAAPAADGEAGQLVLHCAHAKWFEGERIEFEIQRKAVPVSVPSPIPTDPGGWHERMPRFEWSLRDERTGEWRRVPIRRKGATGVWKCLGRQEQWMRFSPPPETLLMLRPGHYRARVVCGSIAVPRYSNHVEFELVAHAGNRAAVDELRAAWSLTAVQQVYMMIDGRMGAVLSEARSLRDVNGGGDRFARSRRELARLARRPLSARLRAQVVLEQHKIEWCTTRFEELGRKGARATVAALTACADEIGDERARGGGLHGDLLSLAHAAAEASGLRDEAKLERRIRRLYPVRAPARGSIGR
ncbi:MAG: hypothetical protein KAI24_23725 [Planctomycetes bacterium]|nr:hypothetical protein [Planctomycetota bacterium]